MSRTLGRETDMSQTTYNTALVKALQGMHADCGPYRVEGKAAEGELVWGSLVQRGTLDSQVTPVLILAAADVDAVTATPLTSTAAAQVFVAASFDGVVGAGLQVPAKTLSFAFNSHADWDATAMVITYETIDGEKTDIINVTNGGNDIQYSQSPAQRLISIDLPAQTGTNGTLTVGFANTEVALSKRDFPGIAMYAPGVTPSTSTTGDVDDHDNVDILTAGVIWVLVEAAVTPGMPCYVRTVLNGTDLRGQLRGSPAAEFSLWNGGTFISTAAQDTLAKLEVK